MLGGNMPSMKLGLVVGVGMILSGWLSNAPIALACSCVADVSTSEQFENATIVFVGTVGGISRAGGQPEVTFANVRGWKGTVEEGMVVKTGFGDCGVNFEIDREYVVFGQGVKNVEANICNGTQLSTEALIKDLDDISGATASPGTVQGEEEGNLLRVFMAAVVSFIAGVLITRVTMKRGMKKVRS